MSWMMVKLLVCFSVRGVQNHRAAGPAEDVWQTVSDDEDDDSVAFFSFLQDVENHEDNSVYISAGHGEW